MPERRDVLLRGLAGERRAARRHRQPRRPLDPRRVPRPLGPRRARRRAASPTEVKAHLRRAARRAAAHEAPLRPPPAPARASGAARSFWGSSPERGGALFHAELDGYDDLLDLDLTAPRRAARPPAPARLHARQARPLLRAPRPAAVPGARGAGRRGLGVAVVARRRRPLRRQRRLPAGGPLLRAGRARRRPGRCSTSTSPGASTSTHYRGRSAYTFAEQAAERAVREAAGLTRGRRPRARRARRARTSRSERAARLFEVGVAYEPGELTYLTCASETLRHPRHYAAGILRESAA